MRKTTIRSAAALLLALAAFAALAPDLTARDAAGTALAIAKPIPIRAKSATGPAWNKLLLVAPPKGYTRVFMKVATVPRGQRLLVRTAGVRPACGTPHRWNTKTTPWRSPSVKVRRGCALAVQVLIRRNDARMSIKFFALP